MCPNTSHDINRTIVNIPSSLGVVSLDRVEYFYLLALEFKKRYIGDDFVMAVVGRPTAPISPYLKDGMAIYSSMIQNNQAIEYGDLQGESEYRDLIARALQKEYETAFDKDNIIFTVGGKMGLSAISHVINNMKKGRKVVNTLPVYENHKWVGLTGEGPEIVFIDTLEEAKMSADLLEKGIYDIPEEEIGTFVFCSPNNPMGWFIGPTEWERIAKILRRYPHALIVLDEAYFEMVFGQRYTSLITVAPDLKSRIILLRSATKGLSAAGERAAILATWNTQYMSSILKYQAANLIHPPKSIQFAYSYALSKINTEDYKKIADFYQPKVRLIEDLLDQNGFRRNNFKTQCTFYVIADFSKLIGRKISQKSKEFHVQNKELIENDVDIACHLMTEHGLAFMPLSLFDVDPKKGLLRITCSMNNVEIQKVQKELSRLSAA